MEAGTQARGGTEGNGRIGGSSGKAGRRQWFGGHDLDFIAGRAAGGGRAKGVCVGMGRVRGGWSGDERNYKGKKNKMRELHTREVNNTLHEPRKCQGEKSIQSLDP